MTARGVKAEEVVAFVAGYIAERGYSPSIRDICDGVGLKSTQTVARYLASLRTASRVTWLDGQSRTLRVVETRERAFADGYNGGGRGDWLHSPPPVAEPLG